MFLHHNNSKLLDDIFVTVIYAPIWQNAHEKRMGSKCVDSVYKKSAIIAAWRILQAADISLNDVVFL